MKIYKVMKFWANGWNEGHNCLATFSTKEKAERYFKEKCLSYTYKADHTIDKLWGDYIKVEEID